MKFVDVLLLGVFWSACTSHEASLSTAAGGNEGQSSIGPTGGETNLNTGGTNAESLGDGGLDAGTRATNTAFANVTAVSTSGSDGAYTFSVSVESSDVDCTEYADWWEVLTTDGALIYRRILDHSHTDENGTTDPGAPGNTFTRSSDADAVNVSADQIVVVRAHTNVAGYVGMAMQGSVAIGFLAAPEIPPDFAADLANVAPQPQECLF